jgi:hypothetical protein
MKPYTALITFVLANLIAGCGVKKEDHQKAVNELNPMDS